MFEELLPDESEVEVKAGECHTFEQDVTKNFESGNLIFSTPGAPETQPDDIDESTHGESNWVLDIDFSQHREAQKRHSECRLNGTRCRDHL